MDEIVRVLIMKNGDVLVSKIEEIGGVEIGEPDCLLTDTVIYDETAELDNSMVRYPSRRLTSDTKFALASDNILTIVTPDSKLLSEYLVAIS